MSAGLSSVSPAWQLSHIAVSLPVVQHTSHGARANTSLTVPVHQGADVNDTLAMRASESTARPVAVPGIPVEGQRGLRPWWARSVDINNTAAPPCDGYH